MEVNGSFSEDGLSKWLHDLALLWAWSTDHWSKWESFHWLQWASDLAHSEHFWPYQILYFSQILSNAVPTCQTVSLGRCSSYIRFNFHRIEISPFKPTQLFSSLNQTSFLRLISLPKKKHTAFRDVKGQNLSYVCRNFFQEQHQCLILQKSYQIWFNWMSPMQ